MTDREWIARFAAALGVPPPEDEDIERVLRLASIAAHASARAAAPVACWLAASAGTPLQEAIEIAGRIDGDGA
jgi:Domain of unknown function (DUF6457)